MPTFSNDRQKFNELSVLLFYNDDHTLQAVKQLEKQIKTVLSHTEYFQINTLLHPKIGESFRVKETPLVLVIQNGREVWRQTNGVNTDILLTDLSRFNGKIEG